MSTLSSPRPSITSARSPSAASSRRPSVEHTNSAAAATRTASASPSLAHRRNRVALRDYYNLQPGRNDSSQSIQTQSLSVPGPSDEQPTSPATPVTNRELDNPSFDAEAYVNQLLETSSLSTILRAENSLINDIRTLDGERKALVYDNYSKLIKAVETIGKMRANIEEQGGPMVMAKTLTPAVGFVAETATALIREQEESKRIAQAEKEEPREDNLDRQTVRWTLDTPRRLKDLLSQGKRSEAEADWSEIETLLSKWEGVKGVGELKEKCEKVLAEEKE